MNPATNALVIQLVELAVQETPALITEIQALLAKPDPTPADWQALRDKVLSQSFESLAPDAPTA